MTLESHVAAAVAAVERAGFANVRGGVSTARNGCDAVVVCGACPCGLGESEFGVVMSRQSAEDIGAVFYRMAVRHIADDRAAGRWT